MGNYNVLSRPEALRLFQSIESPSESFAIRPESVKLIRKEEKIEDLVLSGCKIVEGTIHSASVLGTILRYSVDAAGVRLTIDVLNDGRTIGSLDQRNVRLMLDPEHLLHLEKEGA